MKPIIAVFQFAETTQHAERVEHSGSSRVEVISVVPGFHFRQCFCRGKIVPFGESLDFRLEIPFQFFFADTANRGIRVVHANIVQLVEIAEHAYLGEFCHPGEEHEPQVAIGTLEYPVKRFQRIAVIFQ